MIATPSYLEDLNDYLSKLEPKYILEWTIDHLPNLYQTTAFGVSGKFALFVIAFCVTGLLSFLPYIIGLVALVMINKISLDREESHLVSLIFLDTFYHFDETLDLGKRCKEIYGVDLQAFKPMNVKNSKEFENEYGTKLWETDEDTYGYLVKVEPSRRAYEKLNAKSVITGHRRSQKRDRSVIPILEVDSTGLIKLNPLAYWDFQQVWAFIRANEVPYNAFTDQGYRSAGDWHSTKKPNSDVDDERDGRWSGKEKTECGLHKDYFQMRAAFMASKKET